MEIGIICVPFQTDMARWGMARGPQAILDAGLIARLRAAGHTVAEPIWIDFPNSERTRDTVTNLGRIAARTSDAVRSVLARDGAFALALEGNCCHALGPMGGIARTGAAPGVVWFDAHGDMNTMATTTSGMWGGMPYAVALGWDLDDWREAAGLREPVRSEAAALVGASDLDPAEIAALESHPILRMDADRDAGPGRREPLGSGAWRASRCGGRVVPPSRSGCGRTRRRSFRPDSCSPLAAALAPCGGRRRDGASGALPRDGPRRL